MSARRAALFGVAVVAALTAACGGSDSPAFKLDSSPRPADDQGVVTAVSRQKMTLDGSRSYKVSDDLVSFSAYDRSVQPLLGFENSYVHVGVRGEKVVWLAGIGVVVPGAAGTPRGVVYSGSVRKVEGGQAFFADGTVLRLADGVQPPVLGQVVQARIDIEGPKAHRVTGFIGA